jgi:hypothetical protein
VQTRTLGLNRLEVSAIGLISRSKALAIPRIWNARLAADQQKRAQRRQIDLDQVAEDYRRPA